MFVNRPLNIWACLPQAYELPRVLNDGCVSRACWTAASFVVPGFKPATRIRLLRYQKTGTPLNKELREYVEQMNKSKTKVEPEEVVVPSTGDPPPKPEAEPCLNKLGVSQNLLSLLLLLSLSLLLYDALAVRKPSQRE